VLDRSLLHTPLPAFVESLVAAGVDWVQVRERALGGEALRALTLAVQQAAQRGAAIPGWAACAAPRASGTARLGSGAARRRSRPSD